LKQALIAFVLKDGMFSRAEGSDVKGVRCKPYFINSPLLIYSRLRTGSCSSLCSLEGDAKDPNQRTAQRHGSESLPPLRGSSHSERLLETINQQSNNDIVKT
jgi:hypothetical protein